MPATLMPSGILGEGHEQLQNCGVDVADVLAVEGRHVLAGHAGGLIEIHPNEFYLQNWPLVGVCMGSGYGADSVRIEEEAHAAVRDLLEKGAYRRRVTRVVSLEGVPGALRELAERRTMGRVVARL